MAPISPCGSAPAPCRGARSFSPSPMNPRRPVYIKGGLLAVSLYTKRISGEQKMADGSNIAAHIDYDDLRGWLAHAERLGEVKTLRGASWQEDIGLVAEAILRAEHGPCVVFDEVPGSPKGFRLLLNMFAGVRRNMTLGFPDHLTKWELSDAYREAYLKDAKIIPHEM